MMNLYDKREVIRSSPVGRAWDSAAVDAAYTKALCQEDFPFGTPDYYARYQSRYKMLLRRFAQMAPSRPVDVLDMGGGQLALLCNRLWHDHAAVADLAGERQLDYLRAKGLTAFTWNLCTGEQPCVGSFDFIFFSEVIEHLPLPGYVVLDRLRRALRPGGILICSTPNFYRLKNIVHLTLGLPILDHMQLPGDSSLGHVIEYSRDGLKWQLERAGFQNCTVEYRQMHHSPTKMTFRVLSWMGYPLFLVPRFRDNLLATASAP